MSVVKNKVCGDGYMRYSGSVNLKDEPHGVGEFEVIMEGHQEQGAVYCGQMQHGMMHGVGCFCTTARSKVTGEFIEGSLCGFAERILPNQDVLSCLFVNGKEEGWGQLHVASGAKRIGKFVNGVPQGQVLFLAEDGTKRVEVWSARGICVAIEKSGFLVSIASIL
jgi:hypothetical protein